MLDMQNVPDDWPEEAVELVDELFDVLRELHDFCGEPLSSRHIGRYTAVMQRAAKLFREYELP